MQICAVIQHMMFICGVQCRITCSHSNGLESAMVYPQVGLP